MLAIDVGGIDGQVVSLIAHYNRLRPTLSRMTDLSLEALSAIAPSISEAQLHYYAEACAVAMDSCAHKPGVIVRVTGTQNAEFTLSWSPPDKTAGWQEPKLFVENGAYAIAFLLVPKFTKFEVVMQARIGTGVDYWLAHRESVDQTTGSANFLAARLEVSGIHRQSETNQPEFRLSAKQSQAKQSAITGLPVCIVIVEFGSPRVIFSES